VSRANPAKVSTAEWRADLATNRYWSDKPTAVASMLMLLEHVEEAEALLGEVIDWLGVPEWDGPQLPDDLARRIAGYFGSPTPCENYTARSWSPGSERPEDARCVNCGKTHGPAVGGSESRVAPGQPADGERSAPPTDLGADHGSPDPRPGVPRTEVLDHERNIIWPTPGPSDSGSDREAQR
jgi:hypothetical protein